MLTTDPVPDGAERHARQIGPGGCTKIEAGRATVSRTGPLLSAPRATTPVEPLVISSKVVVQR